MKVFISYSTEDGDFVGKIAQAITPHGEVRYWDRSKEPGADAWPTIFRWIDESDTMLVVITDKVVRRGMSVGQEIGHAKARGKFIIPLVEEGVPASSLGCLSGVTYEPIPRANPALALERLGLIFKDRKQQVDDAGLGGLLAVLGLIALVLLVFSEKRK